MFFSALFPLISQPTLREYSRATREYVAQTMVQKADSMHRAPVPCGLGMVNGRVDAEMHIRCTFPRISLAGRSSVFFYSVLFYLRWECLGSAR